MSLARSVVVPRPAVPAPDTPARDAVHLASLTFDITQDGTLFWVDVERGRWEIPDLCHRIELVYDRVRPGWVGIENQGLGLAVFQTMHRTRVPIRPLKPGGKDKVERATKALVLLEQGKVFHPAVGLHCPWLKDLETELLLWEPTR